MLRNAQPCHHSASNCTGALAINSKSSPLFGGEIHAHARNITTKHLHTHTYPPTHSYQVCNEKALSSVDSCVSLCLYFAIKRRPFCVKFQGGGGEPRGRVSITWRERLARMKAARRREIFIFYDSNKVIEILNDGQTKHGNALD